MFLFVLSLILLAVGIPLFVGGKRGEWHWSARAIIGNVLQILGGVFLIGTIVVNLAAYAAQVGDKNSISQFEKNKIIYTKKADNLTTQFKGYLAVQYPKYEKEIFATFTKNPRLMFAAYPQLQASTTLVALVQQISQLQNAVYDQDVNITQVQKDIETRRQNPFYLGFLLP